MYFFGSSSSRPLVVLCAWSCFVISIEQNDFLGDRMVVGQSSAEDCSQVSCGRMHGQGLTRETGYNSVARSQVR